jgi:GNAT superfamily N-acetyltransferase
MEYLHVEMYRPHMRGLPSYPLPAGYRLRHFRPGDRETWLDIWQTVDDHEPVSCKLFDAWTGGDTPALRRRCLFLVSPDGLDIGTAAAWYDRDARGQRWGRHHWVAIVPEFRSQGLSKPLVSATMNIMRSLRHRRAVLGTQTPRIAAIRTYLCFGFRPRIRHEEDRRAWGLVQSYVDHHLLAVRQQPSGPRSVSGRGGDDVGVGTAEPGV